MPDDTPTPEPESHETALPPGGLPEDASDHLIFSIGETESMTRPPLAGPAANPQVADEDPRFDDPDDDPLPAAVPRPRQRGATLVLVGLLAGIVGAALSAAAVWWLMRDDVPAENAAAGITVVERVETQILTADDAGPTAAVVAARVLPSIVTVEISTSADSFVQSGSGSGVVLDSSGLLVTNHHVVDGASGVRVVFADGRTYRADVVGSDALTDLAVISIEAVGLIPVELGSSDDLDIGDMAIAVGSPLGLQGGPSVTVGVVSAFDRRVRTAIDSELFGMLQTDAPITRGSSGGALVDRQGRLIGITTAIAVSDVGAEGLGFAIPVELVTKVTDELIESGRVSHAFLGITGQTYFDELPDGAVVPSGVAVESIIPGTAAEDAGLAAGDIIRSFAVEPLVTMEQLVVRLRFYSVGDVVELAVTRGGEDITIQLTLMERPEGV